MMRRQQRRNSTMTGSMSCGRSAMSTQTIKSRTLSGDEMDGRPACTENQVFSNPAGRTNNDNTNNTNGTSSESIQVCVRVRPLMFHEQGTSQCVDVVKDVYADHPCIIKIAEGDNKPHQFTFDETFPVSTTQKQVFQRRVTPLIERCIDGYNATVLAYGQTGAGKTHTMMGPAMEMNEDAGVIPRAITKIFQDLDATKANNKYSSRTFDFEVRVQFLEIYGEEIRDLLAVGKGEKLTIRDAGLDEPEVLGAAHHKVESAAEALSTLSRGMMRRVTASTEMNASSSRSHAIMSLIIDQNTIENEQEPESKRSKFNFVDLAGAERQKRTKATGQRLKEGVDINKGLLVLGNVISALGDPKKKKSFVPYRDSKLTRLLKGSLGGNHKSLMIACVSPSDKNAAESLNCLRYANRAKNIKNKAVQIVDPKSKLVAKLKNQMVLLASDLLRAVRGEALGSSFSLQALETITKGGDVETPDAVVTSDRVPSELPPPAASSESSSPVPHASVAPSVSSSDSPPSESPQNDSETAKLRDELQVVRTQLAERDEREQVMMQQTMSYLEEINRLQELANANSRTSQQTSVPVVQSQKSQITPSVSIDIQTDTPALGIERKSNGEQEIMSATTDVCGCVFLTVATSDGVKLIKDTSECAKNHGAMSGTKQEPKRRPSWLQRLRQ